MTDFAFNASGLHQDSAHGVLINRREHATGTVGFGLFLLLNVVLFLRPADILLSLEGAPIYQVLMIACAVASIRAMVPSLKPDALSHNPTLICIIGLLFAIMMASLSHFNTYFARVNGLDFLKTLIYFLLLVSLVTTRWRLDLLLKLILWLIVINAALALLAYHGLVQIDGLTPIDQHMGIDETGTLQSVPRLVGPGIFNDPNDFAITLVSGLVIGWKVLRDGRNSFRQPLLIVAMGTMAYAFALTLSRGGMLSLIAALATLLTARFGWRRALAVCIVVVPALLLGIGGRQANINMDSGDTAQGRIHLWRDSLVLFHHAPIFGIGANQLTEVNDLVAHNSYVQAFAELGIVGGTLFVGAVYIPTFALIRQCRKCEMSDRDRNLAICLLAVMIGYIVGMYSLTRIYTISTYVILGVATAGTRLIARQFRETCMVWNRRLVRQIAVASFCCLLWLEVFVRLFVN